MEPARAAFCPGRGHRAVGYHPPPAMDFLIQHVIEPINRVLAPIGNVISRIVLSVLYFVLMTLPAMFVKLCQDPLRMRRPQGSNFTDKRNVNPDLAHARRQG